MSNIGLQSIESKNDAPLAAEQIVQALLIAQMQCHQFFVPLHQIEYGALSNLDGTTLEALMDLWDAPVFGKAPGSNQGDHVQPELAMRECPSAFFFGPIGHVIAGAVLVLAATYRQCQLA